VPSPFIKEISPALYEEVIEQYGGVLIKQSISKNTGKSPLQSMGTRVNIFDSFKHAMAETEGQRTSENEERDEKAPQVFEKAQEQTKKSPMKLGYCRHKVFGRGKIIEEVDADKVRVNFAGMGLKVIMKNYLTFEE
jgi:DNA helicase-2/ATP-dependent DNA helicase PcrA